MDDTQDTGDTGDIIEAPLPQWSASSWTFDGESGQVVDIVVEPLNPDFNLVVDVQADSGTSILAVEAVNTVSGRAEIQELSLPTAGEYTIYIYDRAGLGGRYKLTIQK